MRTSTFLGASVQVLVVVATLAACGPALEAATEGGGGVIPQSRKLELEGALAEVVARHGVNTAGLALIRNGQVVWQRQYGQQSPGVPASATTLFDVASLTKTVTAETILRLVADGKLSLDEPMSDYWVDPDLRDDPRHQRLTARMALSHTTGFMNWRFFAPDGKLGFINEPGERFGYSGEGFEYVAKYAENKLGTGLEELVKTYVFEPIGMMDAAISVRKENFPRIAKPLDADGTFYGYYCRPEGWCRSEGDRFAAGSMVITVSDYARFMISSMHGEGLSAGLEEERDTIRGAEEDIDCSATPAARCPTRVGYGLGWYVAELENDKLIGHRGSDWSAVSLAYYYKRTGDGLVIFFNAPNKAGIAAMVDALELLDPESPEIHGYKTRRARASE